MQQCLRAGAYRVIKSELQRQHWYSMYRVYNVGTSGKHRRGRTTRAIMRVQDKRIGESTEEKAVNPRGSSCVFHCESRAYKLARFMANPSSGEPVSCTTCVVYNTRHEILVQSHVTNNNARITEIPRVSN